MKKTLMVLSAIIVSLCCLGGIAFAEDGPCEFYDPYGDDPYDPDCGICTEGSPLYDPEFCDPCDPYGYAFDPYHPECGICNPDTDSYDLAECCYFNPDDPECPKENCTEGVDCFCDLYPDDPDCCIPGVDCYCDLNPDDPYCEFEDCVEGVDCFCDLYPDDPECSCTPGVDCYCDLHSEDDYFCNPCNPEGDVYDPDYPGCDPCEFYDPHRDDPYDPECGPCNEDSPNYDPDSEICDPCDPWGPAFDPDNPDCGDPCDPDSEDYEPELCDPCNPWGFVYDPDNCDPCDPDNPYYDPWACDPCNEWGLNFDETANCDPCDPESPAYNPHDEFMQDPCNPWGCVFDPDNSDCVFEDPCDPESPDYDPLNPDCMGWRPIVIEPFDEADLGSPPWMTNDGWAISDERNHNDWHLESVKSAGFSSAGGGYPAAPPPGNWMIYGPIDLSNIQAADLNFSLFQDIEADDHLVFSVSDSADPTALLNGIYDEFHGSTGGEWWDRVYFNLNEYAGKNAVFIAWGFMSESGSTSKEGVFIDEIELWGSNETVEGPEWTPIFSETFDDATPLSDKGWSLFNSDEDDFNWGFEEWYFSAWPFSGGGLPPEDVGYPATSGKWMIYGPIDLSSYTAADIVFAQYRDIPGDTDWLGFFMGTAESPDMFRESAENHEQFWFTGASEQSWTPESFDLNPYTGQSNVYIGWFFESESGSENQEGVYIDDIEIWASADEFTDPFEEELEGWWDILAGPVTFDEADLSDATQWTLIPSADAWNVTDEVFCDWNPDSSKSASAVPVGEGYPAGVENWMFYGPIDLSEIRYAEASFNLSHDLEFSDDDNPENDDWLAFGVAFSPNPDDVDFTDWRTGSTEDFWDMAFVDMSPFVGMPEIYLAWKFKSHAGSATKAGAFIDEIEIWGERTDGEIPDFEFDEDGFLIPEDDFYDWDADADMTGNIEITEIDGNMAVVMDGEQILFRTIGVPRDATDLFISFSYAIASDETEPGDSFCVSLTKDGDPDNGNGILVDFGCWDALDFPEHVRNGEFFEHFEEGLSDEALDGIRGENVAFTIELYQNLDKGTGDTELFVSDVSIYVTGESDGYEGTAYDFAEQLDQNEPNDKIKTATPISCGKTLKGVFGDIAGGGDDMDFFVLTKVPAGKFTIDIDAESKRPPSAADTVLELYDGAENLIAENDDEEDDSFDSKLTYDNPADNATFYVKLYNYDGEGGPEHFYDIKVTCGQDQVVPEPDDDIVTPEPDDDDTDKKAWTVMIFANGDNDLGTDVYHRSRQAIEQYIGSKSTFLNVAMLIDGHPEYSPEDQVNTLRYAVQPNGNYTSNVNQWDMGELNMGDPQTLIDFAKWAMSNYPADHYYLAVDDHGNGPDGISWDKTSNDDQITPPELRRALKEISQGGEKKIDIFDYEACLMGLVENAYDLKDFVDYVAFFQPISWTSLNYPEYFRALQQDDDALAVAKQVIRKYPVEDEDAPYTYSLVDTSKLGTLREKIDAFAEALMSGDLDTIKAARNASQAFLGEPEKGNAEQDSRGYIDLWDLADNIAAKGIAASEATDVKTAVEAAVLETKAVKKGQSAYTGGALWDYSNFHGVSILFPSVEYTFLEDYANDYQMSKDGKWDEFLMEKVFGTDEEGVRAKNFSTILIPRAAAPTSGSSGGETLQSGDPTGDGKTDIFDLLKAVDYMNLEDDGSAEFSACDVDGNGKVDLFDLLGMVDRM